MAFICEDLAPYGIVLVSQSDEAFPKLLAEIARRPSQSSEGTPPVSGSAVARVLNHKDCAILVNRAEVAIAHLAYVWSFQQQNGRITTSSRLPGTQPSLLLPFTMAGLPDRFDKIYRYWNTIFPGSKRLLTPGGECIGDNTDVSTPAEDERWSGGTFGFSHLGRNHDAEPLKLTIDGIFFVNGGFAGPNQLGSWDQLVAARDIGLGCASQASNTGPTPADQAEFFDRWQRRSGLTGQEPHRGPFLPPPRPPVPRGRCLDLDDIHRYQQETVARKVLMMRDRLGHTAALTAIAAWQDDPGPVPHKL